MRAIKLFVLLTAATWAVPGIPTALAMPIATYQLDIIFSSCTYNHGGYGERPCAFTDPVRAGVTYSGKFTIDASVLETDGYKNTGFESFYFALGSTVWDSTKPLPESDYVGSRQYDPTDPEMQGFGPWTLLVQDGKLAGICCGVYGEGDMPWMDLVSWTKGDSTPDPIAYLNVNAYMTPFPNTSSFWGLGAFSFHQVPEPGTLGLLGIGLVGLMWSCRRRYGG